MRASIAASTRPVTIIMKFWKLKGTLLRLTLKRSIVNFQKFIIQIKTKEIRIQETIIKKLIGPMKFYRTKTEGRCLISRDTMELIDMRGK